MVAHVLKRAYMEQKGLLLDSLGFFYQNVTSADPDQMAWM
jgi:hypothetical protein